MYRVPFSQMANLQERVLYPFHGDVYGLPTGFLLQYVSRCFGFFGLL
jgi:hypothetical protein